MVGGSRPWLALPRARGSRRTARRQASCRGGSSQPRQPAHDGQVAVVAVGVAGDPEVPGYVGAIRVVADPDAEPAVVVARVGPVDPVLGRRTALRAAPGRLGL